MPVYTISSCLMRQCEENDLSYFNKILFKFIDGDNKVAKDKNGLIIDVYRNIPDKHGILNTWLLLMTNSCPSHFETIPVDLEEFEEEEGMFVKLCKETKGLRKMIVYSLQNLKGNYDINNKNCIEVDGTIIELLDRDMAVKELRGNNSKEVSSTDSYNKTHINIGLFNFVLTHIRNPFKKKKNK